MKKFLLAAAATTVIATPALADRDGHRGRGGDRHYGRENRGDHGWRDRDHRHYDRGHRHHDHRHYRAPRAYFNYGYDPYIYDYGPYGYYDYGYPGGWSLGFSFR